MFVGSNGIVSLTEVVSNQVTIPLELGIETILPEFSSDASVLMDMEVS